MSATVSIPAADYAALRRIAGWAPSYVDECHPKQRAFVDDKAKRKCALTSRRGGKSHGIGCWLLEGGEDSPRGKSLFIALTRGKAKSILWDDCLANLSDKYHLGLRLKHDEGQLYVLLPNGHRIWLLGVDNQSEVAKVRGERLRRAVIDEAQAFGTYLDVLIEEAIEPALMDLQGELALTGTPSPLATGYFWAATTGGDPTIARWPTHHWTVLDNPYLPHGRAWLEETKARNNWDDTHPRYRREFLGEWTEDVGALVYPLTSENSWSPDGELPFGLPPGEYSYGLGVDLGFSLHSTAFVLGAVRRGTGQIYILSAYTRSRLIPTALAAHVQGVREMVQKEAGGMGSTPALVGLRVVVDEGALGKGYAEQMRSMGVTCEPAQKTEKRAYQEYVRGLVLTGHAPEKGADGMYLGGSGILVDFAKARELVEECKKLQFDEETGLEDERYTRHAADAFLYLVRAMQPKYDPTENEPEHGSPEAIRREMKAVREKTIKDRERMKRGLYG